MIYSSSFISYIVAIAIFVLLALRIKKLLLYYFDDSFSQVVTATILIHPYSIDALILPNILPGSLSFLALIEGYIFQKKREFLPAILLFSFASFFNISYFFFPFYFFFINYKELKKYLPYALIYCGLSFAFIFSHFLNSHPNPIVFFSYFVQSLLLPIQINIINYGLFPVSYDLIVLLFLLISFFLYRQEKHGTSKEYWPMLFFPLFGVILSPWSVKNGFWDEVVFSPSNFMAITFGFTVMLALNIHKKIFTLYFISIFFLSTFWIFNLFSFSRIIEHSLNNLPSDFKGETISIKRLLAKHYLHEKRDEDAKKLLIFLSGENPNNHEIRNDIKSLPAKDK